MAVELPLSEFPAYNQATWQVGDCVERWSSSMSVSYGCPSAMPAVCLCTDALSSLRVATSVRGCALYLESSNARTATELWASYCSVNAGVSARDETFIEDIPLYTRVTNNIATCVASRAASYKVTFGCEEYTAAPCLCTAQDSSMEVQAAINSCLYSSEYRASASALWSSFCSVNLATPAVRVVESPLYTIRTADPANTETAAAGGSPSGTSPTNTDSGNSAGETSTSSSSPGDTSSDGIGGMNVGTLVGIIIVSLMGSAVLIVGAVRWCRKLRSSGKSSLHSMETNTWPRPELGPGDGDTVVMGPARPYRY